MTGRGARRFIDDLLAGRRPRAFPVEETEVDDLRTAITLRSARPGSGAPREEFVTELHRRLAADQAESDPANRPVPMMGRTRRSVIQGAAIAAAAAAVSVTVDRTLVASGTDSPGSDQEATPAGATLTPRLGDWRTVAASEDLPEGAVRAFDLTSIVGFVQRTDSVVQAVSGTCTHQGCRLLLDAASRRLNCPCHLTAFAVDGELLTHELPVAPPPLPRIATREVNGTVQVFAPAPNA